MIRSCSHNETTLIRCKELKIKVPLRGGKTDSRDTQVKRRLFESLKSKSMMVTPGIFIFIIGNIILMDILINMISIAIKMESFVC